MKIECTIDAKLLTLSVNSNKPLSLILMEDIGSQSLLCHCKGEACGNCVVLLNDEAVLSCVIPAFRLKNAVITTFESYQKTRLCRDIERAYQRNGNTPCPNCYASKTLIIESILQSLTSARQTKPNSNLMARPRSMSTSPETLDESAIMQELSLNTCQCMHMSELIQIVETALTFRRRKRVRRN